MKGASADILTARATEKSWASVFADLTKARLTLLVLLTTLVGFLSRLQHVTMDYWLMVNALAGTALVAAGAAALNQLLEREHDAKMRRTQSRPLPSGRLQPTTVMLFGRHHVGHRSCLSRARRESAHQRPWRGDIDQFTFSFTRH